MKIFRFFRYKYLLNSRKRHYASIALSIALAHASFGHARFRSVGNGISDIELSLDQDQKFQLRLNKLDEHKHYTVKGKWTMDHDNYVLQFKRSKFDIPSLFSSNTGFQKPTFIEGKRTVKIPAFRNGVVIDGIYCPRLSA